MTAVLSPTLDFTEPVNRVVPLTFTLHFERVNQMPTLSPHGSAEEARNVAPSETCGDLSPARPYSQNIARPSFTVSAALAMMSLMLGGAIYVFVTYLH
jgi:hypothetical protein